MRAFAVVLACLPAAAGANVLSPSLSKDGKTVALPSSTSIEGCTALALTFAPVGKTAGAELPVANSCDGTLDKEDVAVADTRLQKGGHQDLVFHAASGGSVVIGAVTLRASGATFEAAVGKRAARRTLELDDSIGETAQLEGGFVLPGWAYLRVVRADTKGGPTRREWIVLRVAKGGPRKPELVVEDQTVTVLRAITERACACQDKRCMDAVLVDYRARRQPKGKLNDRDRQEVDRLSKRLAECYSRVR
jgi:hypothetical protein